MRIRPAEPRDLPALIELTIEAFRPLFEEHWPALMDPAVFVHDHGAWEEDYRTQVPGLLAPERGRFITLAEDDGGIVGFTAWNVTGDVAGCLELVAVRPSATRRGVGRAVCLTALEQMRARGVTVVHVGTGGDAFHAPARALYESLGFTGLPAVDYSRSLQDTDSPPVRAGQPEGIPASLR
jgi:ribosomal protein S18 acetylase RimI-like enzyme